MRKSNFGNDMASPYRKKQWGIDKGLAPFEMETRELVQYDINLQSGNKNGYN